MQIFSLTFGLHHILIFQIVYLSAVIHISAIQRQKLKNTIKFRLHHVSYHLGEWKTILQFGGRVEYNCWLGVISHPNFPIPGHCGKVHQSCRKFSPWHTNKAKKLHHWGKNHTKENHHNKGTNEKGVELHICKTFFTPTGENKDGYWLRQDFRTTLPWGHSHS